jgi:hypothetical protein
MKQRFEPFGRMHLAALTRSAVLNESRAESSMIEVPYKAVNSTRRVTLVANQHVRLSHYIYLLGKDLRFDQKSS